MGGATVDEIKTKLNEYSSFVERVLQPQLRAEQEILQVIQDEIDDYNELHGELAQVHREETSSQIETEVDLGFQTIYCRAVVKDPKSVFVHTGMGFHVEFSLPEALIFVQQRMEFLKKHKLEGPTTRVKDIRDHIGASTGIMQELEREMRRLNH